MRRRRVWSTTVAVGRGTLATGSRARLLGPTGPLLPFRFRQIGWNAFPNPVLLTRRTYGPSRNRGTGDCGTLAAPAAGYRPLIRPASISKRLKRRASDPPAHR